MDSRLNSFLQRADAVLERLEPLLPAVRMELDWNAVIAARWQREGRAEACESVAMTAVTSAAECAGDDAGDEVARGIVGADPIELPPGEYQIVIGSGEPPMPVTIQPVRTSGKALTISSGNKAHRIDEIVEKKMRKVASDVRSL